MGLREENFSADPFATLAGAADGAPGPADFGPAAVVVLSGACEDCVSSQIAMPRPRTATATIKNVLRWVMETKPEPKFGAET